MFFISKIENFQSYIWKHQRYPLILYINKKWGQKTWIDITTKKHELKGIKSLLKLYQHGSRFVTKSKKTYIYIEGIFTSNEVAMWFGH